MRRVLSFAALFLSGALTALAFPSVGFWPLILVGFVPLLVESKRRNSPSPTLAGLAWGSGYFGCLLSWLYRFFRHYGGLNPVLSFVTLSFLVAYLALYPALFSFLAARWLRRFPAWEFLLLPSLWVALEWVRGHLLSGFPWGSSGYALTAFLPGIQIASMTGIYGVSFLVILFNTLMGSWIARLARGRTLVHARDAVPVLLIAGAVGWGCLQLRGDPEWGEGVRVAVVQASVPQDRKWNKEEAHSILEQHERLTENAAAAGAALVLWPESSSPFPITLPASAAPGGMRPNEEYRQRLEFLARRLGVGVLFGAVDYRMTGDQVRPVNAAALIRSDGTWGETYAKMHLVPFGEYVPMTRLLGFVNRLARGAIGDFLAGDKPVVVTTGPLKIGTAICYEMIFPELVRRFTDSGATLLANLTNDAWFGTTAGPYQHFQMVRVRAVENRRYVVRAANTGISAVVDPEGRVVECTHLMEKRILVRPISPRRKLTLYTRYGDVFAILCAILVGAALAADFSRPGKKGEDPADHE